MIFLAIFEVIVVLYICFMLRNHMNRVLSKKGVEMLTWMLGIFLPVIGLDLITRGIKHADIVWGRSISRRILLFY